MSVAGDALPEGLDVDHLSGATPDTRLRRSHQPPQSAMTRTGASPNNRAADGSPT